jgi:glutamate dehydrogenase/leucine dehydrogenase
VRVQKLESTDGFVLTDLDGTERCAGVARLAPKVLQDSAEMLARSVTYSFATFELKYGGASAGINAKPDGRDAALTAFVEEITPLVESGALHLRPSTGLTDDDFRPLGVTNTDAALVARGAVAAAEAVLESLEGKTVAVYGSGHAADDVRIGAVYRKARVLDSGPLDALADVMFIAGKQGMIDHEVAATMQSGVVIPISPVPVTSKAYATFRRLGITYIPDFVSIAGPLLLEFDEQGGDPVERVRESVREIAGEGPNAWLVAIGRAEAFLSTWQDAMPFGRPLAS